MKAYEERPATIVRRYAAQLGCSFHQARAALERAESLAYEQALKSRPRTIVIGPCRDCGEDLDEPHVLGAHLPDCRFAPKTPVATRPPEKGRRSNVQR